ncbi:MAG TPA: hypothetical protein VHJ20_03470 [Polyangia bacterium]|nr:hypothetical protein [Polyangia bacterium]
MTLQIPRRWLGYSVWVNSRLAAREAILDRFEVSDIPLTNTFDPDEDDPAPEPFVVSFGPGVEPTRLMEVLALLEGLGAQYLFAVDGPSRKDITIGASNMNAEPITPLTEELSRMLAAPSLSATELHQAVRTRALPALEYRLTRR